MRESDAREDWGLYMLTAVEVSAREGVDTVEAIRAALLDVKQRLRARHRFCSQNLINNLTGEAMQGGA